MEVATLISHKAHFPERKVIRHKEGYDIMMKGTQCLEDITILNMCVPNNRASKYMVQKLLELHGEINESTILVGDFNIALSEMGTFTRLKISKDIDGLNTTIN